MRKALLLGCGNIGALYDWENEAVQTYARALSLEKEVVVSAFDVNQALLAKVTGRYGFRAVAQPEPGAYGEYDLLCIATPTAHHFEHLRQALLEHVPLVICEKPVAYEEAHLRDLSVLARESRSRVWVNYIRRFQPAYQKLRATCATLLQHHPLTRIVCRYRRGLLNNGTHGLDLIQYLLRRPLDFSRAALQHAEYDAFPNDPTVSCTLPQGGFEVIFQGLPPAQNVFDLTLTMENAEIRLRESGDTIEVEKEGAALQRETGAIRDYMRPVLRTVLDSSPDEATNFLESAELNRAALGLLRHWNLKCPS